LSSALSPVGGTTKEKKKMSFGRCPRTKQTFAQKFHAGVFESLPPPSAVTADVQFARAQEIEAGVQPRCPANDRCTEKHQYLFVMINDYDNKGGFWVCPTAVKECGFLMPCYPASFRWFVIDPREREEVLFLYREICDFWDGLDAPRHRKEWWYKALHSHTDLKELDATPYEAKPETNPDPDD
jgi:hypothetical protein